MNLKRFAKPGFLENKKPIRFFVLCFLRFHHEIQHLTFQKSKQFVTDCFLVFSKRVESVRPNGRAEETRTAK